ncbi:LuxR C-terminal-related transcriptional regulator [Nocardia sp. NPDC050378]|uniref:response regulator transcription factor n=1 Tax=Nocardia sp. NPDC050378 TaxID=3155400 RepID=UPI0033CDA022
MRPAPGRRRRCCRCDPAPRRTPVWKPPGVRIIVAGDTLLSPAATKALIARFLAQPEPRDTTAIESVEVLTTREREAVVYVAEGLANEEVAERMYVRPLTVRTHVQRAMTELGARHRAQLVVIAFRTGLVRAGPPWASE